MADSLSNLWNRLQSGSQLRLSAVDRDALKQRYPERAAEIDAFFETLQQAADQASAEVATAAMPGMDSSNDATLPPRQQPAVPAAVDEDAVTLLPVHSSDPADEFATVIPINQDNDATLAPAADSKNLTSPESAGSRVRYFGDYELLSEIARGGMGVVYKARQVNLNRVVALKMILAGNLASEEEVQRFRTEAEAAANLDHPGIVPIFEIGLHEGQHFFSMGYVDGCSLADRVRNGPLPPKEAAELTKKIAEAIAFAHSRNVIHRDLKPANVLLDQNGEPKVTDFGLARKTDNDSGMTRTGAVMGTPSYMPPEQAAGKTSEVGPLSDVYSLGAMLYCLLTGRPPFQAANPIDTLMQVMEREPVALTVLNPLVPRDLETICLKCLQKDPAKRYASAREFAADLVRWLKGEPIQARAVTRAECAWRWMKRNPMVSGLIASTVIALLSGTAISTYFGIHARWEAEQTEATFARSNYFLAVARWNEYRAGDAIDLLERIPEKHRQFEWYLARRQFEGGDFTCYGHESPVIDVSMTPDGSRIVSASLLGFLSLWNAVTGEELFTMYGHSDNVFSVSVSPDGTRILSASADGTMKLWDATTGMELRTLEGHTDRVFNANFSPDGTQIISGSVDCTVKLWDAETGTALRTFTGHTNWVTCACFSPDGTTIASGSCDNTIKLWTVATGTELRTLKGHSHFVKSVCFSPDGTHIASGSNDQTVRLWDAATGGELLTLKGHSFWVHSVEFSPDGTRIASGSEDNTIKLWDARTGDNLGTLSGHTAAVHSVTFSPDGTRIFSGSGDGTVKSWDATTIEQVRTLHGHGSKVNAVSFSPDGKRFVSGGGFYGDDDISMKVWDPVTGNNLLTLNGHTGGFVSVRYSPDGTRIVSGSGEGTLKLWDATSGEELLTLKSHTNSVSSVNFSPDGTQIVSGSCDDTIKLWNATTGEELRTLTGHSDAVESVSFSPDGLQLVSGSRDHAIKLWNVATGTELGTLKGHSHFVNSVCFSPDGIQIVSGSADHTIRIWDANSCKELRTLKGHAEIVSSVNFSPDGMRIVSGCWDNTIKLWDAVTGEELRTLKGHAGSVNCVTFNPEGTQLVSGSNDDTIKLWEATPSDDVRSLKGHTESVIGVKFSRDGNQMLSSDESQIRILWDRNSGMALERYGPESAAVPEFPSDNVSADGRWLGLADHNAIRLVDRHYNDTPRERAFRESTSKPKPYWHEDQLTASESRNDWYAATFHRAWLLKINPPDAWLYDDLLATHRRLLAASGDKAPAMPAVALEMLKLPRGTDLPQLNERSAAILYQQIWELVKRPAAEGTSTVSDWHLQRMQDVCSRFAKGSYFNTLGVLQYRLGRFEDAIVSLNKSIELSPAETGDPAPSLFDLGFLAMSYFKTNDSIKSNEMYAAFRSTASLGKWNLQPDIQRLIDEVETTLQKSTPGEAAVSIEGFNREATFEGLYRHHWQLWPDEIYVDLFGLASEHAHDGQTCLQASYGPVMAYQAVTVEPNTKYRLTGWIRYELPPTDPAGESTPAASNQAEAVQATTTTETDSPSEPLSTPIPGASIGLLNRPETSEVISATTDWKQVTLEFTTTETETTISPGFRLGHEGQQISGTAWFDDLKLEKVDADH